MSRGSRGAPPVDQLDTPAGEKGVGCRRKGVGPLAHKVAKAASISRLVLALRTWICSPMARAAGSTSLNVDSVLPALAGLTSTATRAAAGTSSRRSSSRFAANSAVEKIDPCQVAARPGEAGDKTKPDRVFADGEDDGDRRGCRLGRERRRRAWPWRSRRPVGEPVRPPAPAADRVDSRPSGIRSPRSRPRHSRLPSGPGEMRADRPRQCQAMRRRGTRSPASPAAARAPRAATPAAPPSSVMNSRRFIRSPRRRARAASAGTSRPSAFAALRLMTSSNLVGCSTGRSPGFAPSENLDNLPGDLPIDFGNS